MSSAQQHDKLIDPLMRSFMYGQFANLFKFAFWWVALSPLLYALCDGSTAIGIGRIVYNSALCLTSPFGPLIIEHYSPRNILLSAASVRFIVWCILLPLNWVLFDADFANSKSQIGIYAMMVVMLLLDGASVGLSSVLDIDMMGVDIVAGYLGLDVTEEHRNQFNSRQELFFSICFIIFAPGMAFLGLALKQAFEHLQSNTEAGKTSMNFNEVESGALSGMFFVTFFIATILQFYYWWGLTQENADAEQERSESKLSANNIDSQPLLEGAGGTSGEESINGAKQASSHLLSDGDSSSLQQQENENNQEQGQQGEGEPETCCTTVSNVLTDLKESFLLVISHRAILFRLIFFGFELAFEDASIVVLAAQIGIRAEWMGGGDAVKGSIWTSVIVAVGKIGAAIASYVMMAYYHPPENIMGHTKLFICIGLSTLVIIAIPLAFDAYSSGNIGEYSARVIVFLAFACYFFLSTLPKLGLMSLLQTMVSQVENGHRAFSFIAILATTIDSVVIMVLSLLFTQSDKQDDHMFSKSLWITSYIFLAHGLLETIFGPILILRPALEDEKEHVHAIEQQKQHDQEEEEQKQQQQGVTATSAASKRPSSPTARNESPTGDLSSSAAGAGSHLEQVAPHLQAQPATYSARGISAPVPMGSGLSSLTPRRGPSNLGAASGGGISPRIGAAGGISPRLGGNTPRLGGGMGISPRGAVPIPLSPRQQQDAAASGAGSVRQNVLGTTGGSVIAASAIIRNRSNLVSGLDNQDGAGSYVRSARSQSRLG